MLTSPERTPEGKWVLYRTDGRRFERWPVDARDMLATGGYTAAPPTPAIVADAASVAPSSESPAPVTPVPPVAEVPDVAPRSRRRREAA